MGKKTGIRIRIMMVIVVMTCFCCSSFAVDLTGPTPTDASFGTVAWVLNLLVGVLSWIWVIFAKLAGELLTNKWVYGEVLGLDSILWQYRNVVKNIANYCLGFYFVYVVFSSLKEDDVSKKIKNLLLWMVIAGVGIQTSWFFTGVVLDVSTISIAAAGAFPSQVISSNPTLNDSVKLSVQGPILSGVQYVLFPNNGRANKFVELMNIKVNTGLSNEQIIDAIMPSGDDVGGPLYYMGVSIIEAFNINSVDAASDAGLKRTILDAIVMGGTTIVYSIEMGLLCILALMRLLYMWMFIVLSPIVVLLWCIQKSGAKLGGKGLFAFVDGFTKEVNFKSFFINVFKPTIIVIGIGLTVMLVTLIKGVIKSTEVISSVPLGGVTIVSKLTDTTNAASDKRYTTSIISDSGLLNYTLDYVGKGLFDFILSVITVVLVYFVLKIAMTMGGGTDFVSRSIDKLQNKIGNTMTSMPIVPVPGYDENGVPTTGYVSMGSALGIGKPSSILNQKISNITSKFKTRSSNDVDKVLNEWGFVDDNSLTSTMQYNIAYANGKAGWQKLVEQRSIIGGIKTSEGRGMTLNPNTTNKFWSKEFEKWLEDMKNHENEIVGISTPDIGIWREMIQWRNNENNKDKRSLQNMFAAVRGSYQAYATFFGLGTVTTWAQLIEKDISSENDTSSGGEDTSSQNQSSGSGGNDGGEGSGGNDGNGGSGGSTEGTQTGGGGSTS